jgi:hypothetical protein
VDDDDLKQAFLPRVKKSIRPDELSVEFTPIIQHLTDIEVEKLERDRMRDTRYATGCNEWYMPNPG